MNRKSHCSQNCPRHSCFEDQQSHGEGPWRRTCLKRWELGSHPRKKHTQLFQVKLLLATYQQFSTNPSTSTKNIAYQKISRGMRSRFKTTQLMPSVMFESWLPLRRKTARPRSIYAPILRDLAFAGFRVTNHHRQICIGWCIYGLFPKTGIGMYVNVHCILCYFEDHPISQSGSSSTPSHSFGMLHANGTQDP